MKVSELLDKVNSNLHLCFVDELQQVIGRYYKPAEVPGFLRNRNVNYIQPEWHVGELRIELEDEKNE